MRKRVDATRTKDTWVGLNEVFETENVKIINKIEEIKEYRVIHDDEIKEEELKDFIKQFVLIPITNGKEKGMLVSDIFKRVPYGLLEEFGEFVYITSYKECMRLLSTEFIRRENKIDYKNKNAIEFIKEMLTKMELLGAADLNLSWTREHVIVTYSINGKSYKKNEDIIDLEFAEKVKTSIVNMSYENNSSKIIDGKFFINILNQKKEFRLSVVESIAGFSIAIRSYEKFDANKSLKDLGYTEKSRKIIENIINENPYGMFLVSGKTGSGKTTTIYTIIMELYKKYNYRIKTAEDPVELELEGIDQCQINKKGDPENWITYLKLLSSFLRQKPDIMVISEIRDKEVAMAAIEASLTGHNVISTLHTSNVKATFTRLTKTMGISQDRIEDSMSGVLNQVLVDKLCDCKVKDEKHGFYKKNEEGCEKCRDKTIKGLNGLIPAVEIASLNKMENNHLEENFKEYYSYKECAKDLFELGLIDYKTKEKVERY